MLISDSTQLRLECERLAHSSLVYIDTEFVRERTYYPLLCLVQLAGEDGEPIAVDVLSEGIQIKPLIELLYRPDILKIFHAGRQDLEIFFHITGRIPPNLFDTQIAAMILGMGEQLGYEALIRHLLGKQLCKAQQFTDWSRRPLSDEQLAYALDDVRYLREAFPVMMQQLETTKRLEWVEQEMMHLHNPAIYTTHPEGAWQRIRKRDKKPHYLARLQRLSAWREREAMQRNLPRGKILPDDALQEIALTNPRNLVALQRVRKLPKSAPYETLLHIITEANTLPREECPALENTSRMPDPEKEYMRDMLKLLMKVKAKEHNMTASLLCDKDMLETIIDGVDVKTVLEGWRYDMFGRDAELLLAGKLHFFLQGNAIKIEKQEESL